MSRIECMPTQEELEWYISGMGGGKDYQGTAVYWDSKKGQLITEPNFQVRVQRWKESLPPGFRDPYQLIEMPDSELLMDFINCTPGVIFDFNEQRILRINQL